MTDEELLGVIGHEVGHVAHRDSKKGFRTALLTSALKDGVSSQGGKAAALTDSQLGDLTEALVNARYSQKQERDADDYGNSCKNPYGFGFPGQGLQGCRSPASWWRRFASRRRRARAAISRLMSGDIPGPRRKACADAGGLK